MTGVDVGRIIGRGVAFGLGLSSSGQVAFSTGAQNVAESLQLILATQPGERLMRPSFGAGLSRFLFEPNTPATHREITERITRAVARSEPRVRLESVDVAAHPQHRDTATVDITYRLVATGEQSTLQLDVAVAQGANPAGGAR